MLAHYPFCVKHTLNLQTVSDPMPACSSREVSFSCFASVCYESSSILCRSQTALILCLFVITKTYNQSPASPDPVLCPCRVSHFLHTICFTKNKVILWWFFSRPLPMTNLFVRAFRTKNRLLFLFLMYTRSIILLL
jgi:hypothetical protein